MVKKAVQRGRSKRGGEGLYSVRYVEPPGDARTKLADFFNILLAGKGVFTALAGIISAEALGYCQSLKFPGVFLAAKQKGMEPHVGLPALERKKPLCLSLRAC